MGAMVACPGLPEREDDWETVRLNMYDIGTLGGGACLNSLLRSLGTGVFHCGVEVYDQEWSYSDTFSGQGSGVFPCRPRECKGHTFRESVLMGHTALSRVIVLQIIDSSKQAWMSSDYHVLQHNCCHYSDELCRRLGVGSIPKRILSMSEMGAACVSGKCTQGREGCPSAPSVAISCCRQATSALTRGKSGELLDDIRICQDTEMITQTHATRNSADAC